MAINKRVQRWLAITSSIGIAAFIGVRMYVANSAPFKTAKQYLITNPIVVQKLGEVKSASLSFTGPSRVTPSASPGHGDAEMSVSLEGISDSAEGHLTLKQSGETWEVTGATLRLSSGDQINLMQ